MRLTNFVFLFLPNRKKYFSEPLDEAARKFNVNAVDCSSVLRITVVLFVFVFL